MLAYQPKARIDRKRLLKTFSLQKKEFVRPTDFFVGTSYMIFQPTDINTAQIKATDY